MDEILSVTGSLSAVDPPLLRTDLFEPSRGGKTTRAPSRAVSVIMLLEPVVPSRRQWRENEFNLY